MLIFTRRIGEKIIIGNREVNMTILGQKDNQVWLGFDASKEISIHRSEIFDRIESGQEPTKNLKINEVWSNCL